MDMTVSRALMADSLGFHVLFVLFATGLPVVIVALELYGWWWRRPAAVVLARRWAGWQAVIFSFMLVSTGLIGLQFALFWPGFVNFVQPPLKVVMLIMVMAAIIEAVALIIYLRAWQRLPVGWHWLCGVVMAVMAITLVASPTSLNAFMNTPAGFSGGQSGKPLVFQIKQALFNPATPLYVAHSVAGYVVATAGSLLGWYAWCYRRRKAEQPRLAKLLAGLALVTVVTALIVVLLGDRSARFMAKYEPAKFAASQGVMQTGTQVPLTLGGWPTEDGVKYGLSVPGLLSLLVGYNLSTEITGWHEFPPAERPSVLVHLFFDAMVLCGLLLMVLPGGFLLLKWRWPQFAYHPKVLWGLIICGGVGPAAVLSGWLVTELGRQPYVVQGYLRVADALTNNPAVMRLGWLFPLTYVGLIASCLWVLRRMGAGRAAV